MTTSEKKTVEQRLDEWAKQPGAVVTPRERLFIEDMRAAARDGVGYGWMQQIIEWEWQSKGSGALGPEYTATLLSRLAAAEGDKSTTDAPDARRYRWLNNKHNFLITIDEKPVRLRCGEPLDVWIDARLAEEQRRAAPAPTPPAGELGEDV